MNSIELSTSEYHSYYEPYIAVLGSVDLMVALKDGLASFINFIKEIPEEKFAYSYADGKWSLAEVLLHLIDSERVFQHRAFRFARNDQTELPGFDQDLYVPASNANSRSKVEIIEEFISVRKSSITLFTSFSDETLKSTGTASDIVISVRALGFIMCGHVLHHKNIIQDNYLK